MNPFMNKSNNGNIDLSAIANNPMFQMLKGRGMNNEQIVRYICQQRGIDFNSLMEQAKQLQGNNR